MNWYNYIIPILTGLAATIPLVVKLIEYVRKAVQEKNWNNLIALVIRLMEEAETKFDTGIERKEWVLKMVEVSADTINYNVDVNAISDLIDTLCDMTKVVNAPEK